MCNHKLIGYKKARFFLVYLGLTINHICIDTYPIPIVNVYNFVIKLGYELKRLYGLDTSVLELDVHEFNKDLTNNIILVSNWIGPLNLTNNSYKVSNSNIWWPWAITWNIFVWIVCWFIHLHVCIFGPNLICKDP
jgi:hypothetical protein